MEKNKKRMFEREHSFYVPERVWSRTFNLGI